MESFCSILITTGRCRPCNARNYASICNSSSQINREIVCGQRLGEHLQDSGEGSRVLTIGKPQKNVRWEDFVGHTGIKKRITQIFFAGVNCELVGSVGEHAGIAD